MTLNPHALRAPLQRAEAALVRRADASADAAEREVHAVWGELLRLLEGPQPWPLVERRAAALLRSLGRRLVVTVGGDLADAGAQARRGVAEAVRSRLPARALAGLAEHEGPVPKADELLLPLPGADLLHRIVYASGWAQRLAAQTSLASPEALAAIIAAGVREGKPPAEIARDVRPVVQGIQTSARRIARTEAVRVAHEVQLHTWEGMGPDLVVGYQVHSVHGNPNSRWWHLKRDGTQYFREPKAGQKGFRQMPRPPAEAEDPAERPAGTPQIAPNCLCYLTPILADL